MVNVAIGAVLPAGHSMLAAMALAPPDSRMTMSCLKTHSLTIRPAADLERELEAICAETGPRGDIVPDPLRRQLQLMRIERLRRQALPFGEAAGWLTDDDVFAAVS
jgi:hypothetical protein